MEFIYRNILNRFIESVKQLVQSFIKFGLVVFYISILEDIHKQLDGMKLMGFERDISYSMFTSFTCLFSIHQEFT